VNHGTPRGPARQPRLGAWALLAAMLLHAAPAWAHKPSDSYLTVTPGRAEIHVRWDIAVRDLEFAVGIDSDGDGRVTWGELRAARTSIRTYTLGHLALAAGGHPCVAERDGDERVVTHSDGAYVVQYLVFRCPVAATALSVDYSLLFDLDPQHRGIARLDDGTGRVLIFDTDRRHLEAGIAAADRRGQLAAAIRGGVHHIWTGYDHILFLMALLLPAVLRRRDDGVWVGVTHLRSALGDVARVVTAFTLAHSLTLTLAALGLVSLPSRLVESLIAASVILAAANNLYPLLRRDRWIAAFALGLLHGFGFAATLNDAGLSGVALLKTLFGFNAGVEIGQLTIVAIFVPLAFALRQTRAYRRLILVGGSLLIAVIASVWLVERAFATSIWAPLFARIGA
jgi:hypothetical protein